VPQEKNKAVASTVGCQAASPSLLHAGQSALVTDNAIRGLEETQKYAETVGIF
jgi:hypothetical protein